ncbi:MAG: hypothetical protein KKC03_13140 [Bacteroidetes bacterium]|nr:hypothetical protein [Bacteroidota bacterium]
MKIQGPIKFEKGKGIPQKVLEGLTSINTPFGKYFPETKTFKNKKVITSRKPGFISKKPSFVKEIISVRRVR